MAETPMRYDGASPASWLPPTTGALLPEHSVEGVLVYRKKGATPRHKHRVPDVKSGLLSLNTICPYYTMFPLEFPLARLARARAGEWVLDPFCGRGTTLFASRLRGLGCVGIDSNPIAAAIAAATPGSARR